MELLSNQFCDTKEVINCLLEYRSIELLVTGSVLAVHCTFAELTSLFAVPDLAPSTHVTALIESWGVWRFDVKPYRRPGTGVPVVPRQSILQHAAQPRSAITGRKAHLW